MGWVPIIPIAGLIATVAMASKLALSSIILALLFIAAGIGIFFTRSMFANSGADTRPA